MVWSHYLKLSAFGTSARGSAPIVMMIGYVITEIVRSCWVNLSLATPDTKTSQRVRSREDVTGGPNRCSQVPNELNPKASVEGGVRCTISKSGATPGVAPPYQQRFFHRFHAAPFPTPKQDWC